MAINLTDVLTDWVNNPPSDLAEYAKYLDIQDDNGDTLLHLALRAVAIPNLDTQKNINLNTILEHLNKIGYNYFIKNDQQQTAYTLMSLNPNHSIRLQYFNRDHNPFFMGEGKHFAAINALITKDWQNFAMQDPDGSDSVIRFLSEREWPLDEKIYKISPNGPVLSIHDLLVRTGQTEKLKALILMKEQALAKPFQAEEYIELSNDVIEKRINRVKNGMNEASNPVEEEQNVPPEQEQRNNLYGLVAAHPFVSETLQTPEFHQGIHLIYHETIQKQRMQQYDAQLVVYAQTNLANPQQSSTTRGMFGLWMTPAEDSNSRLYKQEKVKDALQYLEPFDVQSFVDALIDLKNNPLIASKRSIFSSKTLGYIEDILNNIPKDPNGGYLLEGITSLQELTQNNSIRREAINTLAEYVKLGPYYCERLTTKQQPPQLN
ncbi:MAG: hypothetical protein WC748_06215 [Legionellales bacterium]